MKYTFSDVRVIDKFYYDGVLKNGFFAIKYVDSRVSIVIDLRCTRRIASASNSKQYIFKLQMSTGAIERRNYLAYTLNTTITST